MAFGHQELNDVPMLSIAENIGLGLGYPKHFGFWMNKRALNDRASHDLKQIHLGLDPSRKVATLCGDSHTCTLGALGALGFAVGTSEITQILATQTVFRKKPNTMQIWLSGEFQRQV